MVHFSDWALHPPNANLQSLMGYNPITVGNAGYLPCLLSLSLLCNRIPILAGHTEICSGSKHFSSSDVWPYDK